MQLFPTASTNQVCTTSYLCSDDHLLTRFPIGFVQPRKNFAESAKTGLCNSHAVTDMIKSVISFSSFNFMKTANHKLQVFREKHHLTLEEIEGLLGKEKSFTSLHRYESKDVVPQLKLSILYHLLFDIPISHFFMDAKRELRQKLLVRIPNIIDDITVLKSQNVASKKIKVLSKALENLTHQENHDQQIRQQSLFN